MDEIVTEGWEKIKFPSVLEHLQDLTPKETGIVIDSAVDLQFGNWLQNVVINHVRMYWPKFFFDWFHSLQQLIREQKGLVDIVQSIFSIYEKAGKSRDWPGIKIVGHDQLSIWLTNDKFVLKEDTDAKYFPILPGKENESIIRFGQALAHHHPVLSMKTDSEGILESIMANNRPEDHLDLCWPDIVKNFIAALLDLKIGNIIQITKSEILRHHSDRPPLQLQVVKKADLIILFSFNTLIVFNRKTQESRSYQMDDEKQIDEFIAVMRKSASYIYSDLPTDTQQVKQILAQLNNLKKNDSSSNLSKITPNKESDPTIQVS